MAASLAIMKRNYLLLVFILLLLAILSGNLTAGISILGKAGIGIFYKEYSFFTSWWQSASVCFFITLLILFMLYLIDRSLSGIKRKSTLIFFFLLFLAGLYFTFKDFRNDLSHRIAGERFHVGIYLYWINACIISLFFALTDKKKKQSPIKNNEPPNNTR